MTGKGNSASAQLNEDVSPSSDSSNDSSTGVSNSDSASSSGGSDSESEMSNSEGLEESGDESSPQEKADKKDQLTTAVDAILGSRVKAHVREDPILLRNKRSAKEIEDSKLEAKARRLLRIEQLQKRDRARVRDAIPRDIEAAGELLQVEKKLKRTAQRGVVRLLNAIHSAQASSVGNPSPNGAGSSGPSQSSGTVDPSVPKEKFLDMIRSG